MNMQMLLVVAVTVLLLALPGCGGGNSPTDPNCTPPPAVGSCALIGGETTTSILNFQINRGGSSSCPVRSGDIAQISMTILSPDPAWEWQDFRLLSGEGVGPLFTLTPEKGPASPGAIGIEVRFGSFGSTADETSFQISVGLLDAEKQLVQQCDVRVTGTGR